MKYLVRSVLKTLAAITLLGLTGKAWAEKPTVWLIGDSTVQVGTKGQQGWGTSLPKFFDLEKVQVTNRAKGGRSSRTFLTEGLWDEVRKQIKPGDYLLMQFGHNDASPVNEDPPVTSSTRARGTMRNNSDESVDIVNVLTGKPETVHSYGWYLRKFVSEGKEAGAQVIVVSPIPKRGFVDGKARRDGGGYQGLAKEVAEKSGVSFVNLSGLVADKYDAMGEAASVALFNDGVHTTPEGAFLNAQCVAEGIRGLSNCDLKKYLIEPAPAAAAPASTSSK